MASEAAIDICHAAGCRNEIFLHSWREEFVCNHCKQEDPQNPGVRLCPECIKKGIIWCARCEILQLREHIVALQRELDDYRGRHKAGTEVVK